jgi:hypothetical protein
MDHHSPLEEHLPEVTPAELQATKASLHHTNLEVPGVVHPAPIHRKSRFTSGLIKGFVVGVCIGVVGSVYLYYRR